MNGPDERKVTDMNKYMAVVLFLNDKWSFEPGRDMASMEYWVDGKCQAVAVINAPRCMVDDLLADNVLLIGRARREHGDSYALWFDISQEHAGCCGIFDICGCDVCSKQSQAFMAAQKKLEEDREAESWYETAGGERRQCRVFSLMRTAESDPILDQSSCTGEFAAGLRRSDLIDGCKMCHDEVVENASEPDVRSRMLQA